MGFWTELLIGFPKFRKNTQAFKKCFFFKDKKQSNKKILSLLDDSMFHKYNQTEALSINFLTMEKTLVRERNGKYV